VLVLRVITSTCSDNGRLTSCAPHLHGLVIDVPVPFQQVQKGGPADNSQISAQDILLEVDGTEVAGLDLAHVGALITVIVRWRKRPTFRLLLPRTVSPNHILCGVCISKYDEHHPNPAQSKKHAMRSGFAKPAASF
jgi:hypothetical protein